MNSDSQQQASIKTNEFGDTYIDIVNHNHFQTNSAAKTYTQIFLDKLSESKTLYVIIGTDSGLFPKYLSKFPTPEGTQYLFIELNLIEPVINELLLNEIDIRYTISSPSNWEKDLSELELDKYIYDDKVKIIKSLAATDGEIEDYNDLFQQVKLRLNSINHELITTTAQKDHIKNRILNAIDNIKPFTELENKATGPALILGAGPSLNQHLQWIKGHQDKLTIIAVSRIYQLLIQTDIYPDIVVSIDPQEINYQNSKAILTSNDLIFVHSNHVSPQLLAQWGGTSFFCGPILPWKTDDKLESQQHTGPTVTHYALTIASEMGFDDIYLAGVDYCFEASGLSHADGSALPIDKKEDPTVITYSGKMAYTNFFFENSVRHLGEIASKHKGPIYNLSKNAARVDGIDCREDPEISGNKWQKPDIEEITTNQRINHIKTIKNELFKARKNFLEIVKLSKTAIKLNDEIHHNNAGNPNQAKLLKLDKIEKQLNTKFKKYVQVALLVVSRDFMRLLNKNSKNRTAEQESQWLNQYYSFYKEGSEILLSAIKAGNTAIEFREQEQKSQPKIDFLIDYWSENGITGRSCFFIDNKKNHKVTSQESEHLKYLCNEFQNNIRLSHRAESLVSFAKKHAYHGEFKEAEQKVRDAYNLEPRLTDGYIAISEVAADHKHWENAIKFAYMDFNLNKISTKGLPIFARVLHYEENTNEAIELIYEAYKTDLSVKDAFINLGWDKIIKLDIQSAWNPSKEKAWNEAWQLAKNDYETGRYSLAGMPKLANILCQAGKNIDAKKIMEKAYLLDSNYNNGFASMAFTQLQSGNLKSALEFALLELKLDRLNAAGMINVAIVLGCNNQLDKAENLIDIAYSKDEKINNGYTRLAGELVNLGNSDHSNRLAQKDIDLGRLDKRWQATALQITSNS